MRVIRESSADEVESYVCHIHSVYKNSYRHTLKKLSRMNHHKWYLVELDLIDEIGSVINVHEHRDNGRSFWLSTAKESWVEAFRRFPTRSRQMPTHECPKRISAILDEMAENVQYPADFPLILEVTSLRPLGLQHIDGIHRAAAYITGGYEGSVHCYVAVPSHLLPLDGTHESPEARRAPPGYLDGVGPNLLGTPEKRRTRFESSQAQDI